MKRRTEWSLDPTQALYERFLALERVEGHSFFCFPAWWARVASEVREAIGSHAWGLATKSERSALVIAHCDRILAQRRAPSTQGENSCTATISTTTTRGQPRFASTFSK